MSETCEMTEIAAAFGQENVQRLTAKERSLLMADVWAVERESETYGFSGAARELARRIGRGNLVSYAECLVAQAARTARREGGAL